MIKHKLLEQKFAKYKGFSREAQHMFMFRIDKGWYKYVNIVRGKEVTDIEFNKEFEDFFGLVDGALKIRGYAFNSKNYYNCKSKKLNEIGQYCDFLFTEDERSIFYYYRWKTEQELKDIINEATSKTQTA